MVNVVAFQDRFVLLRFGFWDLYTFQHFDLSDNLQRGYRNKVQQDQGYAITISPNKIQISRVCPSSWMMQFIGKWAYTACILYQNPYNILRLCSPVSLSFPHLGHSNSHIVDKLQIVWKQATREMRLRHSTAWVDVHNRSQNLQWCTFAVNFSNSTVDIDALCKLWLCMSNKQTNADVWGFICGLYQSVKYMGLH